MQVTSCGLPGMNSYPEARTPKRFLWVTNLIFLFRLVGTGLYFLAIYFYF